MNNTDLTEKLCLHIIRNSNPLNEEVYERTLYGGPWQFIKDSAKTLLQIRRLKPDDEIILDTIEPVGFLSILRKGNYRNEKSSRFIERSNDNW